MMSVIFSKASCLFRQRPLLCATAAVGAAYAFYRYFYHTTDRRPNEDLSVRVPLEDTQRGLQDVLALDTDEEHLSSRLVLHRCDLPVLSPQGLQTQKSPWKELSAHSSVEPAQLTLDRFDLCKVLGKGYFGKVLLAELKGSGQYFALKALKKDVVLMNYDKEATMVEKRVLALARESPFLSDLYLSFQTTEYLFFVMEYLSGGTLFFHVVDSEGLDIFESIFYSAEVIVGLQFLHAKGIIHRDLKLENVMLDGDGHIKIIDFGLCKENVSDENPAYGICGTPAYMAPEMLLGQTFTFSADWWSFGVLLYAMLTGLEPFEANEDEKLFESIKTDTPKYPEDLTEEALDLLEMVFERDPSLRLGVVGDIRGHPFYQTLDWAALEKRELEPPFKPEVTAPGDCRYADLDVENEEPHLSHTGTVMHSVTRTAFAGFSYANPDMQHLLSANKLAHLES